MKKQPITPKGMEIVIDECQEMSKEDFLALGRQLGTSNKCIKLFSTELQKRSDN